MVIDYNKNKWLNILNAGLYGYNDGGTISDPSDDQYKLINSGANTGALPSDNITAIAVDFDNEIWIGTEQGFSFAIDVVFTAIRLLRICYPECG